MLELYETFKELNKLDEDVDLNEKYEGAKLSIQEHDRTWLGYAVVLRGDFFLSVDPNTFNGSFTDAEAWSEYIDDAFVINKKVDAQHVGLLCGADFRYHAPNSGYDPVKDIWIVRVIQETTNTITTEKVR